MLRSTQLFRNFYLLMVIIRGNSSMSKLYDDGTRLKRDLLQDYDTVIIPQEFRNEPVNVYIGFSVHQIVEFDEKRQRINMAMYFRWKWKDKRLQWNVTKYENLRKIKIKSVDIWTPDIILFNDAQGKDFSALQYEATVFHDGTVSWNFPARKEVFCDVNVKYYPFDQQISKLIFMSWGNGGNTLNIFNASTGADLSLYKEHAEWRLVHFPAIRHVKLYQCCPEPYPDVTYYIVIRRRPLFTILNLVIPCIILTIVSLFGFCLPPESGERISLKVTLLLAFTVFMTMVAENMPRQSKTFPIVGQYFSLTIMQEALSLITSILLINFNSNGQRNKKLPPLLRLILFNKLAKILCMHSSVTALEKEEAKAKIFDSTNGTTTMINPKHEEYSLENLESSTEDEGLSADTHKVQESGAMDKCFKDLIHLQTKIYELHKHQIHIMNRIETKANILEKLQTEKENSTNIESEWQLASAILDRLLLIIFLIITFTLPIAIFLIKPNYDAQLLNIK